MIRFQRGAGGTIYTLGLVIAAMCVFQDALAQNKETVLYSFKGGGDGSDPIAALISDDAGNLYGTTYEGGAGNFGTVFKLSAKGDESVLYAFKGGNSDGAYPFAGLVFDGSGNLYGTTVQGGIDKCYYGDPISCGTLFELAPDGTETVLYRFLSKKLPYGRKKDGVNPYGGVLQDQNGNFYGTTFAGGRGAGTVFKFAANGQESVIYDIKDGGEPVAGLVTDSVGNLYGTTEHGGNFNCVAACGTVFEIAAGGTESKLYDFRGGSDGANPEGGLILDAAGNFYGTTSAGGGTGCGGTGCGTVFKLEPDKKEMKLYTFCAQANCIDGATPLAALVMDEAGNLYGTTYGGGAENYGAVFEVSTGGKQAVLYSFVGGSDGAHPQGGLVFDKSGNLCGTTTGGGANGAGTVFRIKKLGLAATEAICPAGIFCSKPLSIVRVGGMRPAGSGTSVRILSDTGVAAR